MTEMIEIIVDIHEQDSEVADYIARRQLGACHMRHLKTGDVILRYKCYTVGIEIKRGQDFNNSLKSGKLHNQIARCTNHFDFPILIIEDWKPFVGDDDDHASIKEKVRKHKMTVNTLNRRITTYETKHLEATVDLIEEMCRDLKMKKLNVLRRPVVVEPGLSDQMKVICSLPNVKEILGERILDKYGTVKDAMADLDNWIGIKGIGNMKLIRIKRTWEEEFDG